MFPTSQLFRPGWNLGCSLFNRKAAPLASPFQDAGCDVCLLGWHGRPIIPEDDLFTYGYNIARKNQLAQEEARSDTIQVMAVSDRR
jgi:hypothetical protein